MTLPMATLAGGEVARYDFEGNNPFDDKSNNGHNASLESGATLIHNFGGNLHDITTKEDTSTYL